MYYWNAGVITVPCRMSMYFAVIFEHGLKWSRYYMVYKIILLNHIIEMHLQWRGRDHILWVSSHYRFDCRIWATWKKKHKFYYKLRALYFIICMVVKQIIINFISLCIVHAFVSQNKLYTIKILSLELSLRWFCHYSVYVCFSFWVDHIW